MLTGRDGELARLAIALADHAPVVVVGPAGVGKSTLCRTALTAAGDWHETGALATLRWSPLLLFRRLLGDAVRDEPDRVAAQVLRLAPGGLLLDDLQWADDPSFEATCQLVGRLPLLATVRSGDPGAEGAEKWLVDAGFERLELAPLGPAASRTVLDAAHPGLAPALRDQVMAQAGGNPLLLSELAGQRSALDRIEALFDAIVATMDRTAAPRPEAQAGAELLAHLDHLAERLLPPGSRLRSLPDLWT